MTIYLKSSLFIKVTKNVGRIQARTNRETIKGLETIQEKNVEEGKKEKKKKKTQLGQ